MPKQVGFIGFDGITALDMVGPMEAFAAANGYSHGQNFYKTIILSPSGKSFRSEASMVMSADVSFADAPALDTIVVPGGAGAEKATGCRRGCRFPKAT